MLKLNRPLSCHQLPGGEGRVFPFSTPQGLNFRGVVPP